MSGRLIANETRTIGKGVLRIVLNSKPVLWGILSIPAAFMASELVRGTSDAIDLVHPSGEFSARLMIVAMMLGPLRDVLGPRPWIVWLVQRRRALGVAGFGYALLHTVFYAIDMATLADMLAELDAVGIWTGWLALALMLPLALTSNEAAVRALGALWKRLQRIVYPAAILVLVHWAFVHNNAVTALIHFAPLALLHVLRLVRFSRPALKGYRP